MLSLAIDLAVQVVLLLVGSLVIGGVAGSVDDAAAAAILSVFLVSVIVGYPVAFETLSRGRTLGKLALGLRVVREDGGPIRFRHALVRGLAAVVEIWLTMGAVALVVSLASSQGKRMGDFLAGTVVVRERVPVSSAPMVTMPPMLAAWASGLDLSRLPDDLALAARQFLARAGELAPEVRESMGARLAASMAARPPPPAAPRRPAVGLFVRGARRATPARGGPARRRTIVAVRRRPAPAVRRRTATAARRRRAPAVLRRTAVAVTGALPARGTGPDHSSGSTGSRRGEPVRAAALTDRRGDR